jgi:hypothetical protein
MAIKIRKLRKNKDETKLFVSFSNFKDTLKHVSWENSDWKS